MKKILLTLLLIGVITISKAQIPNCLKGTYYVSTLLDTFDILHKTIPDNKVLVLIPRKGNLITDAQLNALSLAKRIGLEYKPFKAGETVFYLYENGTSIAYTNNMVMFLIPLK